MKLEFNKIYNALIAIQVLYKHFNPIPYGISIPAVLRGGVKNTPPAKNIFRSVIFQFFYTYNESYVQLAKIKKKIQNFLKTAEKSNFWKIFGNFQISKKSQKCPPFGQISIFWALIFCKHPYFDSSNWLFKENIGL